MRRLLFIVCVAFFSLACARSCKEPQPAPVNNDTRELSVPEEEIAVPWNGGAFAIEVKANFKYKVGIDVSWLTREAGDTSSAQPIFRAEANPDIFPRSCKIRFTDVNDRYYFKEVSVTQGADASAGGALSIVDKNATAETKALLANLWVIADKGLMFGHHDDLWYGRYWYNEAGGSDTKAVCGDYPAVFSVDFGEIMDDRYKDASNAIRRRVILEARERGEVIMACAHINNPKTGKDSWDNSSNEVVKELLTDGSATRNKYITWLDRLADFANNLKDSKGKLVPVIFRMYHEHTQEWSWWGSSCTTASEFTEMWKLTIQYLRDVKGVHNFLYAISPQMDGIYSNPQERIRYRWPGDEWVDFIGMDCYHGSNNLAFISNLKALEAVSAAKRKPCGVTEDGLEGFTQSDFWTRYLVNPTEGRRISMVTMWRNKYVGSDESDKHYFSVYPGHASENDFRKMYALDRILFSKDLPDMYTMPAGYEVK